MCDAKQSGREHDYGKNPVSIFRIMKMKTEDDFGMLHNYHNTWAGIAQSVKRAGWSENRIPVGRDFSHPPGPVLGLTQPPIKCVPGLILGGKAAGAWR
jgi:hypothetical protein